MSIKLQLSPVVEEELVENYQFLQQAILNGTIKTSELVTDEHISEFDRPSPLDNLYLTKEQKQDIHGNEKLKTFRKYLANELYIADETLRERVIATLIQSMSVTINNTKVLIDFIHNATISINNKWLPTIISKITKFDGSIKLTGRSDIKLQIQYNEKVSFVKITFYDVILNLNQKQNQIATANYSLTLYQDLKKAPKFSCSVEFDENASITIGKTSINLVEVMRKYLGMVDLSEIQYLEEEKETIIDNIFKILQEADSLNKQLILLNIAQNDYSGEIIEELLNVIRSKEYVKQLFLPNYVSKLCKIIFANAERTENPIAFTKMMNACRHLIRISSNLIEMLNFDGHLITKEELSKTENAQIKSSLVDQKFYLTNINHQNSLGKFFLDYSRYGISVYKNNIINTKIASEKEMQELLIDEFGESRYTRVYQKYSQDLCNVFNYLTLYLSLTLTDKVIIFYLYKEEDVIRAKLVLWKLNSLFQNEEGMFDISRSPILLPGIVIADIVLMENGYKVEQGIYVSNFLLKALFLGRKIKIDSENLDIIFCAAAEEQLRIVLKNKKYLRKLRHYAKIIILDRVLNIIDCNLNEDRVSDWNKLTVILNKTRIAVLDNDENAILSLGDYFPNLKEKKVFVDAWEKLENTKPQIDKIEEMKDSFAHDFSEIVWYDLQVIKYNRKSFSKFYEESSQNSNSNLFKKESLDNEQTEKIDSLVKNCFDNYKELACRVEDILNNVLQAANSKNPDWIKWTKFLNYLKQAMKYLVRIIFEEKNSRNLYRHFKLSASTMEDRGILLEVLKEFQFQDELCQGQLEQLKNIVTGYPNPDGSRLSTRKVYDNKVALIEDFSAYALKQLAILVFGDNLKIQEFNLDYANYVQNLKDCSLYTKNILWTLLIHSKNEVIKLFDNEERPLDEIALNEFLQLDISMIQKWLVNLVAPSAYSKIDLINKISVLSLNRIVDRFLLIQNICQVIQQPTAPVTDGRLLTRCFFLIDGRKKDNERIKNALLKGEDKEFANELTNRSKRKILETLLAKDNLDVNYLYNVLLAMAYLPFVSLDLRPFKNVLNNELLANILCASKGNLMQLNISGCTGLTKEILPVIEKYCPNLTILYLDNLNITKSAEVVTKSFEFIGKKLSYLSLKNYKNLEKLKTDTPELKVLEIADCTKLSLAKTQSRELEILNLANCVAIKKNVLPNVSLDLTKLRWVNLEGCEQLEYKKFLQTFPYLLGKKFPYLDVIIATTLRNFCEKNIYELPKDLEEKIREIILEQFNINILLKNLEGEDYNVKRCAIMGLWVFAPQNVQIIEEISRALLQIVINSKIDLLTRRYAIEALKNLADQGNKIIIESIMSALEQEIIESSNRSLGKEILIIALEQLGTKEDRSKFNSLMIKILFNNVCADEVKTRVINAIVKFCNPSNKQLIETLYHVKNGSSKEIILLIEDALIQLRNKKQFLEKTEQNANVFWLGRLKEKLQERKFTETDWEIKKFQLLLKDMQIDNWTTQNLAIMALGKLSRLLAPWNLADKTKEAENIDVNKLKQVKTLLNIIAKKDNSAAYEKAHTELFNLNNKEKLTDILLYILKNNEEKFSIKEQAINILAEITIPGDQKVVNVLIDMWHSPNWETREIAIMGFAELGRYADSNIVNFLLAELLFNETRSKDSYFENKIKITALNALIKICDPTDWRISCLLLQIKNNPERHACSREIVEVVEKLLSKLECYKEQKQWWAGNYLWYKDLEQPQMISSFRHYFRDYFSKAKIAKKLKVRNEENDLILPMQEKPNKQVDKTYSNLTLISKIIEDLNSSDLLYQKNAILSLVEFLAKSPDFVRENEALIQVLLDIIADDEYYLRERICRAKVVTSEKIITDDERNKIVIKLYALDALTNLSERGNLIIIDRLFKILRETGFDWSSKAIAMIGLIKFKKQDTYKYIKNFNRVISAACSKTDPISAVVKFIWRKAARKPQCNDALNIFKKFKEYFSTKREECNSHCEKELPTTERNIYENKNNGSGMLFKASTDERITIGELVKFSWFYKSKPQKMGKSDEFNKKLVELFLFHAVLEGNRVQMQFNTWIRTELIANYFCIGRNLYTNGQAFSQNNPKEEDRENSMSLT